MTSPWREINQAKLEDDRALLRPIQESDREGLRAVAFDPEIWKYFVFRVASRDDFERLIDEALADTTSGARVVFAITCKRTGRLAGSMAFGNLAEKDLRLEIGWSWLGAEYRGTGLNAHAKRLLLAQAFDVLGCERVEFKTDLRNERARRGLVKIGATEEGVLRSYNFMPDGTRRNAVYYSVLRAEWPGIRSSNVSS